MIMIPLTLTCTMLEMLLQNAAFNPTLGNLSTRTLLTINAYKPPAMYNKEFTEFAVTVLEVSESITWTIPCCKVIKLNLTKERFTTDNDKCANREDGVIQTSDHRLLLSNDMKITCSEHCLFLVDNKECGLFWKWDFRGEVSDLASLS
ncbi:uncharacterized protein LOC100368031 [Saccoglossus kowalevskii]|uniref:Uncharacterized protein LOC100368031 n=1 Tax=Saccoglossus kowalevskii TaxID=10224 RepID=A0ABM0MCJ0_SACKO|nr:PREDICTED: uncharacterized protein LOC100368031 [Saccoglossus kowalevskii]